MHIYIYIHMSNTPVTCIHIFMSDILGGRWQDMMQPVECMLAAHVYIYTYWYIYIHIYIYIYTHVHVHDYNIYDVQFSV